MAPSSARHTSMPFSLILLLAAIAISALLSAAPSAQATSSSSSCASHAFSSNRVYAACAALPRLGATLHYNYTSGGDNNNNNTVSVAFRAPSSSGGWVAWGINPGGSGMVGARAVVAFLSDGSVVAYPTLLDSYAPSMAAAAAEDRTGFFSDVAAEYDEGAEEMVVYATLALPPPGKGKGKGKGKSEFSHVWQRGSSVVKGVPAAHATTGDNILSTGTIDFSK